MRFCTIILFFFVTVTCYAQGTVTELDSIWVLGSTKTPTTNIQLSSKRIDRRMATDVGQLLNLLPGVQIKSYGGLGGLKTVSFQSLGAGHTIVVMDYLALAQTQSGQTDVGQLPTDYVKKIEQVSNSGTNINFPIHAKLAGQIIGIQTIHSAGKKQDSLRVHAGFQVGSFGQTDAHLFVGKQAKKIDFSVSGKARQFEGTYPFTYTNGYTQINGVRKNNQLQDIYGTANVLLRPTTNQELQAAFSTSSYSKGLPGAIVFYNDLSHAFLKGAHHQGLLRHKAQYNKWTKYTYLTYQQDQLTYTDSAYFNAAGVLVSNFISQQYEASEQWKRPLGEKWELLFGSACRYETVASKQLNGDPKRLSVDGLIAVSGQFLKGQLSIQQGVQCVKDARPTINNQNAWWQPSATWSKGIGKLGYLALNYKYTVRQPSFNELYYQQVGNTSLRPERAQLAAISLTNTFSGKKIKWRYNLQPFYVYAIDKIISLPTKNLFVWSIQNIGKSQALGVSGVGGIQIPVNNWFIDVDFNYTLQYTQDISDVTASTYGHQLSYAPIHTGTVEVSIESKRMGLSTLISYLGERYALNENIPSNLLAGYTLIDASVFYHLHIKNHQFTLRAACNNITNKDYQYVRSFVMPRINYLIRLSYVF